MTSITLTREELYRRVWEKPMVRLAEQYGISGNGLAKICDRLSIPYPPRGFWARMTVGKARTPASAREHSRVFAGCENAH
jgi:hypothetical protein